MKDKLNIYDFIILFSIFLFSILIGVYHGVSYHVHSFFGFKKKIKKSDSVSDYLVASSSMSTIPVAFSILATFFSATALIGIPAEIYQYGLEYWIIAYGIMFCPLVGAFTTGPLFAKLKIVTVFQYLNLRFNSKKVQLIGTICYLIRNFIGTAIYIFGPAVSLGVFMNINDNYSIILVGLIATFYTTIGGIKGVIWTDLFQALVMFSSLFLILIKGIYDVGGVFQLININFKGERINVLNFNPDPFIRQSFWSLLIGNFVYFTFFYSTDQQTLQRFQAARSKKLAQRALLLNIPGSFLILSLCCFVGLVLYASFEKCDPILAKIINNPNQLVGYYVLNNLNKIYGSSGLFLASLFCGSLSSVSSTLNSLSAIIWHDFLQSFDYFKNLTESKSVKCTKLLVIICGFLSTLLSFFIASFGSNLAHVSTSLNGAIVAPILGLFILGCLFKKSNSIGAICGSLAGLLFGIWISFGAFLVKPNYPKLKVSIENCNLTFNAVNQTQFYSTKNVNKLEGFNKIYSISYQWYNPIGTLITVMIGLLISYLTGGPKHHVDDNLILFNLCNKKNNKTELMKKSVSVKTIETIDL